MSLESVRFIMNTRGACNALVPRTLFTLSLLATLAGGCTTLVTLSLLATLVGG